jgi:hypothetical protein
LIGEEDEGREEKDAMHKVVESGWLTAGKVNSEFEDRLSKFTGIRHVRTCNSGSSANLLAVAATGAYCRSMASNYNHLPKPAVVSVREGKATVVLRRESLEDLLRLDPGAS